MARSTVVVATPWDALLRKDTGMGKRWAAADRDPFTDEPQAPEQPARADDGLTAKQRSARQYYAANKDRLLERAHERHHRKHPNAVSRGRHRQPMTPEEVQQRVRAVRADTSKSPKQRARLVYYWTHREEMLQAEKQRRAKRIASAHLQGGADAQPLPTVAAPDAWHERRQALLQEMGVRDQEATPCA